MQEEFLLLQDSKVKVIVTWRNLILSGNYNAKR